MITESEGVYEYKILVKFNMGYNTSLLFYAVLT